MFPHTVAALVIAGVAGTASLATAPTAPTTPDAKTLTCELRLTQTGRTVTLVADAHALHATRGTYTLTVEQRSAGNHATIRQGGEFDLRSGQRSTLAEAQFAGRARDLSAELTLQADGQRQTCATLSL